MGRHIVRVRCDFTGKKPAQSVGAIHDTEQAVSITHFTNRCPIIMLVPTS